MAPPVIRQYFYTDEKGIKQRYYYCVLCSSGPFKDIDDKTLFHRCGKNIYCKKCTNILGIGLKENKILMTQ